MNTHGQAINQLDWTSLAEALDERGHALVPHLLTPAECRTTAAMFGDRDRFRKRVVMARHQYGKGTYQYFGYPLPTLVQRLRLAFFPHLAAIANSWLQLLGEDPVYPDRLETYLEGCHHAGQEQPTPLILSYGAGDFNCLHQDLYGEWQFPLQVAILLDQPQRDFTGGEFVLVEQRPRVQSRASVVPLTMGAAVIFPVNQRPRKGVRGYHRTTMRHGVSEILSGQRRTLGLIFHDAKS